MELDDYAADMQAHPTDEGAARAFYHALAQAELLLLLQREASESALDPQIFDLSAGRMVLAFDSADRLADWAAGAGNGAKAYAVLPGRVLAGLLAAQELALGLNFGAGTASEMVLPAGAMGWLAQILDQSPQENLGRIAEILPLGAVPGELQAALLRALVGAGGLAKAAILARVSYAGGAPSLVLAFLGAAEGAQMALAQAVAQSLAFAQIAEAGLDVIFPPQGRMADALRAGGAELPLPAAPAAPPLRDAMPQAPGMDKAAPPKLR